MGKGLRHDPLADIELIRQNLNDRYGAGFPVLRELLQNADDADAARVAFVWTPGIATAAHPLLRGPALVAINDGRFTDADREAIRLMGLSDKLRQRESIGKFGLGLKSVFHWCEAFFYLAGNTSGDVAGDILNPWSGESGGRSFHEEWDDFAGEDQAAIATHVRSVLVGPPWFCLWIPLRRKSHCGRLAPIQNAYPGDMARPPDFLTAPDVVQRLAEVLPLLAHVREVRIWQFGGDGQPRAAGSVELLDGSQRRRYRREGSWVAGTQPLVGEIRVNNRGHATYCGQEVLVTEATLRSLKGSPLWPRATRVDRETAQDIDVPEKADPYGAAVFLVHRSSGRGTLAVTWAAFLPLGEPVVQEHIPGTAHYILLLHGDFFVDPGRNRPDFGHDGSSDAPQDESDLRRQWNWHLAHAAVVPQVLPALAAIAAAGLSREATRDLSHAVAEAFARPDLERWKPALCREHQWAFCLDGTGGTWRLLPAAAGLVGVPAPPKSDPVRCYEVLPALRAIARDVHVTFSEWPRLCPTDRLATWSEEMLVELLEVDGPRVFGSEVLLEYLLRFLALARDQLQTERVQERLMSLARSALLSVDFDALRQYRRALADFLAYISPDRLLPLDLGRAPGAADFLRALLDLPLRVVPVPKEFAPEGRASPPELHVEDAVAMLRTLASHSSAISEQALSDAVSSLATQILQRCKTSRAEVLERCRALRLFKAHECREGRVVVLAWQQLKDAAAKRCLFTYSPPPTPRGLAEELQQVLDDRSVVLIDTGVGSALFEEGTLSACTYRTAAQALLVAPSLASADRRVPLLRELLAEAATAATDEAPALVSAIRFLLHGDWKHVNDVGSLFTQGEGWASDVWTKLAEQALRLVGAQWRLVPGELSALVPGAQRKTLSLDTIEPRAVAELLWEVGPQQIDCAQLAPRERDQVIRDIDDLDLLRQLVIHADRAGRLHAINRYTFLESEFRVENAFANLVTILLRSQSPAVLDKQRRLVDSWTERTAIRVALEQPQPHRFAAQILNALRGLGGVGELAADVRTRLKEERWLPGTLDRAFAPEYVLHIPGMDDEIAPLAAASEGVFAGVGTLDPTIAGHPAFRLVAEHLMPASESVLDMLGDLVKDSPVLEEYRIGPIRLGRDELELFLGSLEGAPPAIMPALPLIQKATQVAGAGRCVEHLLPGLAQFIAPARLVSILSFLVEQHQRVPPAQRPGLQRIFERYLQAAVDSKASEIVPDLRLLNARGQWRPVRELCLPTTTGIDDAWLVAEEQCDILRPLLPIAAPQSEPRDGTPAPPSVPDQDLKRSAEALRSYFQAWEDHCSRQVIGGFLSLLGDGPIRDLADGFFDNHGDVDATRSRLAWTPVRGVVEPNAWGAATSPLDVMNTQRMVVSVYDPRREGGVRVRNLLGEAIVAPPSEHFEHLLVGETLPHSPVNNPIDQLRFVPMTLRVIAPDRYSDRELSRLLQETARKVLYWVYRQDVSNLDDVWEALHEGEQKDIRVAQNRLAESLFLYVRQLGLHGHPALGDLLRRWDQAQRQRAEAEDLPGRDGERLRDDADRRAKEVREQLKRLLDENVEVQQLFLAAVRVRVERHYQYRSSSIPFELFQNADDAAVELEEMLRGAALPPARRQFHLLSGPSGLSVAHCGRPINAFRRRDFDGRPRGFDADLEKMLVLAASDKGIAPGDPGVTGRFGLGFKSVFLFADRAEVLSGRLAFEVVGGLFPRRLENGRRDALRRRLEALGLGPAEATLVHLPSAGRASADETVARFRTLAHVLVVFSRAIKSCWLNDAGSGRTLVAWNEQAVTDTEGIALGQLTPADETSDEATRALLFRSAFGALLLRLGTRGFRPFGSDIPTIWVTAPTDATERLGFALNASFDLDIGRAQLASHSDHNLVLADRLGAELGSALRSLARVATVDWPALAGELGLATDLAVYEFWDSLWDVLARSFTSRGDETEALRVARRVLWGGPECGMATLVRHHDVIPTALPGTYQALTRLERVALRTQGCLDGGSGIFERVSEWATFQQNVRPGTVVAGEVAAAIKHLVPLSVGPRAVRLADALAWEVGDTDRVDPTTAARLGAVVTPDLMEELRTGSQPARAEHEELEGFLGRLKFLARNRTWRPPAELVVDAEEVDPDERLRAGFAPTGQVLAGEYAGPGLSFFLLCRGRGQPGSQDLARWMREAASVEARAAALRYLASGRLGRETTAHLRGRVVGTWLANLQGSASMAMLGTRERNVVLALMDQLPPPPPISSPVSAEHLLECEHLLERVYAWWQEAGQAQTRRYLAQVYPGGTEPRLDTDLDALRSDSACRKEWLQLFLLGASFTLGGVQREQHRAFVAWCDAGGWLDAFAQRSPDGMVTRSLRDYLERGIDRLDFHYWMRLFVPLFQLSVWLDEYVENFLRLDRVQGEVSLGHVLSPRSNPGLSGGGVDAPPLGGTLGIGVCFVLRELVRLGILTNEAVHEHCYVPSRPVRGFLRQLGCPGLDDGRPRPEMSRSIHAFLRDRLGAERAGLGRAFDIPLLLLAEDPELQSRMLDQTVWAAAQDDEEDEVLP